MYVPVFNVLEHGRCARNASTLGNVVKQFSHGVLFLLGLFVACFAPTNQISKSGNQHHPNGHFIFKTS